MSIVKIQGVKRLDSAVNYITQEHKTYKELVSTFGTDVDYLLNDFRKIENERNTKLRKNTKDRSKMIIQSFGVQDNITPEKAHEVGKKLADNYLDDKHQYIITTHLDGNHIHNHIIFNEVRLDNLKMFDTSRRNTIDNLRLENDKLSKEYGLYIPDERSHENKIHYMNQRELAVRKKGNSFKEQLESTIDKVIETVNDYEEFKELMESKGYVHKNGKHLAFKNPDKNYFLRTKTLGMHYTENSIKHRIDNKDFKIHKYKYTLKTEKIDKSEEKFRDNYGLRKWATKQNITHLQEISDLVFNKGMNLLEIENISKSEHDFVTGVEKGLEEKDNLIYELEKEKDSFKVYKDSTPLMIALKNSNDKSTFKKENYKDIIKHDIAKKGITKLKNDHGIDNEEQLISLIDQLKEDRNNIYQRYTELQKDKNKEQEHNQINDKDKKRGRTM